jgi:transcriptional/translational regulatory protein YebC/TACO1
MIRSRVLPLLRQCRRTFAGHSQFANIKHKKAREDARRCKAFQRVFNAIGAAVRANGGDTDPQSNSRLATALEMAREVRMPKEKIAAAIETAKGSGSRTTPSAATLELVLYEAYLGTEPLLIECLTDNRRRTVPRIRHLLSEHGAVLAPDGSVLWQFERIGRVLLRACPQFEQNWLDEIIDTGLIENLEHYRADERSDEVEEYVELQTTPDQLWKLEEYVRKQVDTLASRSESATTVEILSVEPAWKRRPEASAVGSQQRPSELDELIQALEAEDDVQRVVTG